LIITEKSLVSVIIPSYNHACYIEQAVKSVWRQTYSNIELIVVDDGSRDNSLQILKELEDNSPIPMKVLYHQENKGPAKTLNHGIQESSGDLITLLASDDYFHEDKIKKQISFFLNHQDSILVHSNYYTVDNNKIIGSSKNISDSYPAEGNCFVSFVKSDSTIFSVTIMYPRSLYYKVGGYDECFAMEDLPFFLKALKYGAVGFIEDCLVYKRGVAGSLGKQYLTLLQGSVGAYQKIKADIDKDLFELSIDRLYRRFARSAILSGEFLIALKIIQEKRKENPRANVGVMWILESVIKYFRQFIPAIFRVTFKKLFGKKR